MSWFTAEAKTIARPRCERCKGSAAFVVLVKRGIAFDIYDCKKCGGVKRKAKR